MTTIEIPASETIILPRKESAGRPSNLRILHSVTYENPTWYAERVILDGKGREVGRSRRSSINIETAAEMCRTDAIKLGAIVYRKISSLEAAARRLKKDLDLAADAATQRIDEGARLTAIATRLRAQEAASRQVAKDLKPRADLPGKPKNLPTHLWEPARSREDELVSADAFGRQAVEAESAAAAAKEDARKHATVAGTTDGVSAAWSEVQRAWEALAPTLVGVIWGAVIAAFATGLVTSWTL